MSTTTVFDNDSDGTNKLMNVKDITRLTDLKNDYTDDISYGYIKDLYLEHNIMKTNIDDYDISRNILLNDMAIQQTRLASMKDLGNTSTYMLLLCWFFIFILLLTVVCLQVLDVQIEIPFFFKVILLFVFLFVIYSIYLNVYRYVKNWSI
tara:strand:- start:231 stop:680 length:450 start_codon:yes stop_codon:yes gene_type:complete